MWSIDSIEAVPVELDFSSSDQGRRSATAIQSGDVRLVNAIELIHVDPSATQLFVCLACGITGCEHGGWVVFRRIGDRVAWIPAWDEMAKGDWAELEYRPPAYVETKGAPVFSASNWERLRRLHGGFPPCDQLPSLDSREAARLCQWSAPGRVLGEFPLKPRLRRELLLAVTDGALAAEAHVVDTCLDSHFEAVGRMALASCDVAARPIEFWLDLPGTPGWTGFARLEHDIGFPIDANTALVREAGPIARRD